MNSTAQKIFNRIDAATFGWKEVKDAKDRFLNFDFSLSDAERNLIKNVSTSVCKLDGMLVSGGTHYLSVGLSAIKNIEMAMQKVGKNENSIHSILDFACGYGRVLRFLKARFPNAEITCSEVTKKYLSFCEKEFSVKSFVSDIDFSKISNPQKYDLIWCGSLATHLDENSIESLLKFFRSRLSPGGICLFSMHGPYTVELIEKNRFTYNLLEAQRQNLIAQYRNNGFGYVDYQNSPGFGISVSTHERFKSIADKAGPWKEIYYAERGWDSHQDIYGYM